MFASSHGMLGIWCAGSATRNVFPGWSTSYPHVNNSLDCGIYWYCRCGSSASFLFLRVFLGGVLLGLPGRHGFILVWGGGWLLICYIGGVTKLDRLVASPLGSILDYLHWALSLFLKRRLSCPLVMGWGRYIDGGWNTRFWLVRRSVRALRCIVCCLRGGGVLFPVGLGGPLTPAPFLLLMVHTLRSKRSIQ